MTSISLRKVFTSTFLLSAALALFSLSACNKEEPTADFTYEVSGTTVSFTYTGENGEDFDWDFGDGNNSTDENPSHTYTAAGTYTVELEVENEDGSDSESQSITIEGTSADAPELSFGDADGACYAINTVTIQEVAGFETEINLGTAVAWFANDAQNAFVDVGDVSFQQDSYSGTLEIAGNNSYTWLEQDFNTTGFDDDGGVEWSIDGGNGHASFTGLSNGFPFPSVRKVDETEESISTSGAYTLSHDGSISDADSVIFGIYGPDASLMKTVGPGTTSVTFTAAEMATLGEGFAILQVAGFNIFSQELGGKKYYMVNETVASKTVSTE